MVDIHYRILLVLANRVFHRGREDLQKNVDDSKHWHR